MAIVEKAKKPSSRLVTADDTPKKTAKAPKAAKDEGPSKDLPEEEKKALREVVWGPRVTEKAVALNAGRIYTFNVGAHVTKREVARAVAKLYHVSVVQVRNVNIPRKSRMRGRMEGWKSGYKKMLVKVKEGQTIEMS